MLRQGHFLAKNQVTRVEANIPYCDVSMRNENGAASLSLPG